MMVRSLGLLTVSLLVLLLVAGAFPAQADYRHAERWFSSLPFQDRAEIQFSLIWVGTYNGLVDGELDRRTYQSIRKYQQRIGAAPTGVLTGLQLDELNAAAKHIRDELGFELVSDPIAGLELALPLGLVAPAGLTGRGFRWTAPDGSVEIETVSMPHAERSYLELYDRLSRERANQRVTYRTFRAAFFIVSGYIGDRKFYSRFEPGPHATRGFSLAWDPSLSAELDRLAMAMSSTITLATESEALIPRFEDFPAPPVFRGKNAAPDLSSPRARRYRTRLREGAKEEPNYAGIHTLVVWRCGTSCRTGAAVNAITGKVVFLPDLAYEIHARPDSRLLVLSGLSAADLGLFCFYDFDGRAFRFLRAIKLEASEEGQWPPMSCAGLAGIDRSPDSKLLVVRNSLGGSVEQFENVKNEAERAGAHIRIEGPCHSACTVFLSAENVCLAETAVIGIHGAALPGSEIDMDLTQEWARKYHPPALREWAETVGAYRSREMTTIEAAKLWDMGLNRCQPLSVERRQEISEHKAREQAELLEHQQDRGW